LANQLLTLARAEPGGHRPDTLRPLNLAERVEAAAEIWVPRAVARSLDLGFELEPAWVLGEPLLIGELLANLLDNAIRYTPAGGRITARTLVRGNHALLQVEDDGPGIPEEERARVTERFYRLEGSPGDGCGLGLAIVHEIALAHDAELTLETPPGGKGSLFTVVFPLAANPGAASPV
jgi:two-component system sensor histidine kinase TctE